MTISEETINNILRSWPVGVLSTYGREKIHSVPITFVVYQTLIYSPIDGKPKSGRTLQRVVDLGCDDRFTLLLQHYDTDWRALWWLRVSGHAEVITADDLPVPLLDAIVASLRAKYVQYENTVVLDDPGQLLRLRAFDATAWAFSGPEWLAQRFA